MAKSPNGIKKHSLPNDKRILHATKLIAPNGTATLRFIAPKAPGVYPYLCTSPATGPS